MNKSLLPNNAAPQERAMEMAASRLADVPIPVRTLWNYETCPVALLPWLAWTLSVEAWNPEWPEHLKRGVLRSAVETARHKGTKGSVVQALAALGARAELVEWFETSPPGIPHTFAVNLVGNTNSVEMQDMMVAEIRRTKPLRSHFTVNFGVELAGSINAVGVLRVAIFTRLDGAADSGIETFFNADGPFLNPEGEPFQHLTLN